MIRQSSQRTRRGGLLLSAVTTLTVFTARVPAEDTIADKTLVAWVQLDSLDQRGGSALTIEKDGGVFDGIVFGEIAARRWMAGSDFHRRTQKKQSALAAESAPSGSMVQIAITYAKRRITVYRNGAVYATFDTSPAVRFGTNSRVVMGLRHLDAATGNSYFRGRIEDARIYGEALDRATIESLEPDKPSALAPLAWWNFEDGSARDLIGAFPSSTLVGDARIDDGKLCLGKEGAYLVASPTAPRSVRKMAATAEIARVARELREKLLRDPHRPGYHFVVPEGRCMPFDPNGAIFWKGRYHLFYIFQDHRGHNWGHVSSTDLFHWRHHPTGLTSGMFSGNCFVGRDGRPTICYHQVGQGNAMAVALDEDLNEWKKLASNPITPKTIPGDSHHGKYRSWDPFAWVEGDTYYAIFGGKRPAIAKAEGLAGPWSYTGDLLAHAVDGVSISEDISCADFFRLGNKHMLLCISHRLGCRYYLGDWKDEAFFPESHAKMSWVDNSYFAPESLLDDRGRRIMWAWIFDRPRFKTRMDYGWSGTMSLPRVLSLAKDGTLRMQVPEEIGRLRYAGQKLRNITIAADSESVLEEVHGNSIELLLEFDAPDALQYGLRVCRSADGEEQTTIFFDAKENSLNVDTRASSKTDGPKGVESAPFSLTTGESLSLRVFVDKSVVEVFANDRQAVMRRVYPSRTDSVGVSLFSVGGTVRVAKLDAWKIAPSNPY